MKSEEKEQENANKVVWAMGGKGCSDNAHAYLNEEDLKKGISLCGNHVNPHIIMEHWDLSNKLIQEHTCKKCRDRLKLLNFMRR